MKTTVAKNISSLLQARINCFNTNNTEWLHKHEDTILSLVRNHMPSGSGWDNGTSIDINMSTPEKLVFTGSYHHMDDAGGYDGWTEHTVTVRPTFAGFDIKISGKNRNDIKDYLHDTFAQCLAQEIESV